jgi:hypothetical protein
MSPLPDRESRVLSADLSWNPYHVGDPFDMEFVLDKINDEEQRNALLANSFNTVAEMHQALAAGAKKAAQIIAGGDS